MKLEEVYMKIKKHKDDNSSVSDKRISRRDALKMGSIGAVAGSIAALKYPSSAAEKKIDESARKMTVVEHDEFPNKISSDYKPFNQLNLIFTQGFMRTNPDIAKIAGKYLHGTHQPGFPDMGIGYRQLDHAIRKGSESLMTYTTHFAAAAIPGHGIQSWEQKKKPANMFDPIVIAPKKYKFKTREEASAAIKRAASLYGADLVGITRNDPRWNYTPITDFTRAMEGKNPVINWSDFPFKPKTVIVLGFEMDYEAMATAPALTEEATTMECYSRMSKTAFQLSVFLKNLGYQSVPCNNDTALSVPYAVAAGLGELSRIGILINYKYGPRVRLAKVFTDFDFVEYDKPKTFGVHEFCKRCKRCADACPADAIPFDDEPTWEPTHEHAHLKTSNPGVYKWYLDGYKCFKFWSENHGDCGSCIASCPYNKPDFWHHRLVDRISAALPGPFHTLMKELDRIFGYGDTADKKAVKRFWSAKGRSYDGF